MDDAIHEFTRPIFSPTANPWGELLQIQIDGWEKSRWPDAMMSPKALYDVSYPPDTVKKMRQRCSTNAKLGGGRSELTAQRVEYYAIPFEAFAAKYETVVEGKSVGD